MSSFRSELEQLLNGHAKEHESNTPDFVLAQFIERALDAFDVATRARDHWYGIHMEPGNTYVLEPRASKTLDPQWRTG